MTGMVASLDNNHAGGPTGAPPEMCPATWAS